MNAVIALRRKLLVAALLLLGAVAGLSPQQARANSVKDALDLATTFAPVVDTYIAPASLTWLPGLYDALSQPACGNLSDDLAVANCAGALLDSDAGGALGGSDVASIAALLEIYVDVRGSDWGELFGDIFRLAAAGDPLDVACKVLTIAVGGFPVCGVLELLYDVAKFAWQAAEAIVGAFAVNDWGESEAMDLVAYFNQHFLPKVDIYAKGARNNWQATWNNAGPELIEPCKSYLASHRNARDTADLRCLAGMFKGETAGKETRFIDKGFLQMVSARYAMLELPRVVNDRFLSMAKADSFNTGAPGLRTHLLGVWGLDAGGRTVLDAQGVGAWPNGSIGAVAMARMRLYVAHYGDGEAVMKQKLQEAVDYALANTPNWKVWQQAAAAASNVPCKAGSDGSRYACGSWDQVRQCHAGYAKALQALPRPVGSNRLTPPLCGVEDVDAANRLALAQVNKALRTEFGLSECSYDIVKHPNTIECVPSSESAKRCASLLKQRYGEFGLPRESARCTGLVMTNQPPSVPTGMPTSKAPAAQATIPTRTGIAPVARPIRSAGAVPTAAPVARPPLCTPTAERGVMQCPTYESIAGCERARRLGQVRQCLPPSR